MEPQKKQNNQATNRPEAESPTVPPKKEDRSAETLVRDITPEKRVRPKQVKRDLKSSIRTYYSDVAHTAGGDGKNTKPRKEDEQKKTEENIQQINKQKVVPKPSPEPKPAPRPGPMPTKEGLEEKTDEDLVVQKPRLRYEQGPTSIQKPPLVHEEPKSNVSGDASIRTFQSDVQETIKQEGMSIADIALAEQKRREKEIQAVQKKERKSGIGIMLLLSAILLLGGVGIFGYLFVYQPAQEEVLPDYTTLIFPDQEVLLSVGGESGFALEEKLLDATENTEGLIGTVTALILTENTEGDNPQNIQKMDGEEFLSQLQTSAPPSLIRAINEDFVIGIHHFGDHNEKFIIFTTDLFESVFAGMLAWETTLAEDLSFISRLPAKPGTVRSFGGDYVYKDVVVENKDTRTLTNDVGDMRLIYSFPTQDVLIIASNETTLQEALRMLSFSERR